MQLQREAHWHKTIMLFTNCVLLLAAATHCHATPGLVHAQADGQLGELVARQKSPWPEEIHEITCRCPNTWTWYKRACAGGSECPGCWQDYCIRLRTARLHNPRPQYVPGDEPELAERYWVVVEDGLCPEDHFCMDVLDSLDRRRMLCVLGDVNLQQQAVSHDGQSAHTPIEVDTEVEVMPVDAQFFEGAEQSIERILHPRPGERRVGRPRSRNFPSRPPTATAPSVDTSSDVNLAMRLKSEEDADLA